MRQGSVRTCFRIERCPHLSNSLTSTASPLRRFYAVLIVSVDARMFNSFCSERKRKHAIMVTPE
jgi:hypothetical protein